MTKGADKCKECGMTVLANEYHPFTACAIYKHTGSSSAVDANLKAVVERGLKAQTRAFQQMLLVMKDRSVARQALIDYEQKHGKGYATVNLFREDADRLHVLAQCERRTMIEVVRQALIEYEQNHREAE